MSTFKLALSLVVIGTGCAEAIDLDSRHQGDEDGSADVAERELRVEPSSISLDVVDGEHAAQVFRAFIYDVDGTRSEVTDHTQFVLADPRFGSVDDDTVEVTGGGAGRTQVLARAEGIEGAADLAVHVRDTVYDGDVAGDIADSFAAALPMANCTTGFVYPDAGTLVPANLGALDVRWRDQSANDVYQVRVTNAYVDHTVYTRNANGFAVEGDVWQQFATSRDHIEISLAGLTSSAPDAKCVVPPRTVEIADADAVGALYYSASPVNGQGGASLVRMNLADNSSVVQTMALQMGATCVGCHALSRDGSKMAVTLDGAGGLGAVYDLSRGRMMQMGSGERWTSSTFTPDGKKLLAVTEGQMKLFEVDSGRVLATYANTMITGNPELSPDGTKLVSVEVAGGSDWSFAGANIVVRSFDSVKNALGAAQTLVAFDAAADMQSYYPSWSPDGKWIAMTRSASGTSYISADASVWVVSATGSSAPLRITGADGNGSWARWMPYQNTVRGEKVFFLTYSSTRAYGNQLPEGRQQIWVQPFFPQRAYEVGAITAPAYRAPFQNLGTANHNAQWTSGVVIL